MNWMNRNLDEVMGSGVVLSLASCYIVSPP
jgi:hypothetical protein